MKTKQWFMICENGSYDDYKKFVFLINGSSFKDLKESGKKWLEDTKFSKVCQFAKRDGVMVRFIDGRGKSEEISMFGGKVITLEDMPTDLKRCWWNTWDVTFSPAVPVN